MKKLTKINKKENQSIKRIPGALRGIIHVPDNFNDEDPEINKMFYGNFKN